MQFEFDFVKSELNRRDRGFGFTFVAQVFLTRTLEMPARMVDGEVRRKAVGQIDEVCYAVIYTDRDEVRRIISGRRANRKETRLWRASE